MPCQKFNIFVGAETGVLKGVSLQKKEISFDNLNDVHSLERKNEIRALYWADSAEEKLMIGMKDQSVRVYNTTRQAFDTALNLHAEDTSDLLSLCNTDGKLVTASTNGIVKVWSSSQNLHSFQCINESEGELCTMRLSPYQNGVIATGGREADLKLWDINASDAPVFKAKNVLPDFLQLRVPIWVSDVTFFPDQTIGVCTRHCQIRLYDPRSKQRRPVISTEFEDVPLTSICVTCRDRQVMVGSGKGRLALFDLRKGSCSLLRCYKGSKGSIKQIVSHPTLPVTATVGLDRYILLHNTVTGDIMNKMYMKSRLTCVLMKSDIMEEEFKMGGRRIKTGMKEKEEQVERKINKSGKITKKKKKRKHKDLLDKMIEKELSALS